MRKQTGAHGDTGSSLGLLLDVVGLCAEDTLDGAASSHFSTVADAAGGEPYALTSAAGPVAPHAKENVVLTFLPLHFSGYLRLLPNAVLRLMTSGFVLVAAKSLDSNSNPL